ncbi:hypothetical protein Golob_014326 [Gossypium lobatum]|uniref:RNase H type-1 domain-containing protein n=1 Tax=Gossypium lobatum TaxID=34289 RepID=A0A7J8LXQ5_9ROSI|nr:hypothetical protein [Gossypium lobatum]
MRYNRHLGNCSILDAELWGILDGLTLIHDRQYASVMIQTDNLEAVRIIQDSSLTSSNFVLIRRIHLLLVNAELWVIQHFPRDHNKVVDYLAKMTFGTNNGLKIFKVILREVLAFLLLKHMIVLFKELV